VTITSIVIRPHHADFFVAIVGPDLWRVGEGGYLNCPDHDVEEKIMTVARHYTMYAAEGKGAALEMALCEFADTLMAVAGVEGVEVLRDIDNERRFVFIEKWESIDAHKAAGSNPQDVPAEAHVALKQVMAAVEGTPDGAYLDYRKAV
jgi:quinol monooxygenase YgiN